WWVPLVVLGAAIVMESISFRTAVRESDKVRGDTGWVAFIRGAKAPELPVVLLEDLAALLGLAFALLGVSLTLLTHNGYFDVLSAAAIGVLLVVVAVVLATEVKSLLVGESASDQVVRRISTALEGTEGVTRVIHLKTLHVSGESPLVAAKIGVAQDASAARLARAIDAAGANLPACEAVAPTISHEPASYLKPQSRTD